MANSIELDVVINTKLHYIKRIVIILIYSLLLLITISIEIYNIEIPQYKYGLLILLALWFILLLTAVTYKKLGTIIINNNGTLSLFINNQVNKIKINNLTLHYNGYKGEADTWGIFLTGSWYKDGLQNTLIINGTKYNIFIKSKKDLNKFEFIIEELCEQGINVEIIGL